ncbi:MAG: hypothetical protein ACFFD4_01120 [Candidatus Odinarchaeota archaeon]
MLNEIISIAFFLSGSLLVFIGLYFLKKDYREYLNQLLSFSMFIMGITMILDSIPVLFKNLDFYRMVEYLMVFTICIGAGTFFLAGVTLVKGEISGKSPLYLLPTVILALLPGAIILISQSIETEITEEQVVVAKWGDIGDLLFIAVLAIFLFGSLFYFFSVYTSTEGETRYRLKYFIAGMALMSFFSLGAVIPATLFPEILLLSVISIISVPVSISIGSTLIIYGLGKSYSKP